VPPADLAFDTARRSKSVQNLNAEHIHRALGLVDGKLLTVHRGLHARGLLKAVRVVLPHHAPVGADAIADAGIRSFLAGEASDSVESMSVRCAFSCV
jgi:hypothetical protein